MKTLIVSTLIQSVQDSVESLRNRISDVKPAGIRNGRELISFSLDDKSYIGVLTGRNRDLCVGFSPEGDKAIAARVLIDDCAELV